MEPTIRWVIRRDMPEVASMYAAAAGTVFGWPQIARDWHAHLDDLLRERSTIGLVLELEAAPPAAPVIAAFTAYNLRLHSLEVGHFAVHPDYQRQGYGTLLLDYLRGKIGHGRRRNTLVFWVPEEALSMQLFLRSSGVWCTGIEGDAYRFAIKLKGRAYGERR